jgi:hypothetical protein
MFSLFRPPAHILFSDVFLLMTTMENVKQDQSEAIGLHQFL